MAAGKKNKFSVFHNSIVDWCSNRKDQVQILLGLCGAILLGITFATPSDIATIPQVIDLNKNRNAMQELSIICARLEAKISEYEHLTEGLSLGSPDSVDQLIRKGNPLRGSAIELDGIEYIRGLKLSLVSDSDLSSISETIVKIDSRIEELVIQAQNGTYSQNDRQQIDTEYQAQKQRLHLFKQIVLKNAISSQSQADQLSFGLSFYIIIKILNLILFLFLIFLIFISSAILLLAKQKNLEYVSED